MADNRIDGRAHLVGVSCKCEVGKVTARGAATARIPSVGAAATVGFIGGRGDANASARIELGERSK
jgi:hypothetical protein